MSDARRARIAHLVRVVCAWTILHIAALLLRLFGVKPWIFVLRRASLRRRDAAEHATMAAAWGMAVRRAEWWSVFRLRRNVNCLPRSLTLCLLLTLDGVPSALRIGAGFGANGKFVAHAWVEVDGAPVAEVRPLGEKMVAFETPFQWMP